MSAELGLKETPEEPETLDLDESIRTTLREITSREVPETPETPEPKVERARDDGGKFTKEPPNSAPVAEAPTTPNPAEAVAHPGAEPITTGFETQPVIDITRAPSSWKPAAKAAWQALPEPVRAEIYRREGEFHNTTLKGPLRENADFGKAIKEIVEPYRPLILAEGGTPERAVADTMRTAALFRTGSQAQKLQALFDIDKQYGAGLAQHFQNALNAELAKATGQPTQNQFQDPRVDSILQSLQANERQRQQQEQQRAQQEKDVSNLAVEKFMSAKDDKGQPLHIFVDNVLDDMSVRVEYLRRTNPAMNHEEALKQAYDAAVWANPETRAVLIGQQQAQASQPVETLRKVEQAKRASAGNMPKRGALPATEPPKSLDDTIRETGKALGMF